MLEGEAAAGKLLDALVEVVAFQIDGGRGDNLLVGVDLHREGGAARRLEPRIIRRVVDNLDEAELAIEIDRALVVGAGHGDLVEARAAADVEADILLPKRARALPEFRRFPQRNPDEFASAGNRVGKRGTLGQEQCGRACERAAGAVGAGRVDALALPAGHIVLFDEGVGERVALFVAALDQDRTAMLADEMKRGRDRVLLARQAGEFGKVRRDDRGDVHELSEGGDGRLVGKRGPAGRNHDGIEHDGKAGLLAPQAVEARGNLLSGEGTANHSDLHGIDPDILEDGVNLGEHDLGRDGMDRADAPRVLGGDGGDCSAGVAAQHRHRLDVGLHACATAGIGTGDDQDPGRRGHRSSLRPNAGCEIVHVHGIVV